MVHGGVKGHGYGGRKWGQCEATAVRTWECREDLAADIALTRAPLHVGLLIIVYVRFVSR
jgi:hypothetical protein